MWPIENQDCALKVMPKLVGSKTFLIKFCKSNFYEPSYASPKTDQKFSSVLRRYKIYYVSSLDVKVMTVLRKLFKLGF